MAKSIQKTRSIENTRWQMIRSEEILTIPDGGKLSEHGDPVAYQYADIPRPRDTRWTDAPTLHDDRKTLNFDKTSRLPTTDLSQLDFTYFRTFITIPEGASIDEFKVTVNQVDDGARMMLYNDDFPEGVFVEADDGKLGGNNFSTGFAKQACPGLNMVLIVQFDDCAVVNKLTGGVKIVINGAEAVTNPALPIKERPFETKPDVAKTDGAWTFGWGTPGEDFQLFEKDKTEGADRQIVRKYHTDNGWWSVSQNTSDEPYKDRGHNITYPAKSKGAVILHPGPSTDNCAKARFTAGSDGLYTIKVSWKFIDDDFTQNRTEVWTNATSEDPDGVWHKWFSQTLKKETFDEGPLEHKFTAKLKKGEVVSVEVEGGGSYHNDHTMVTLAAV